MPRQVWPATIETTASGFAVAVSSRAVKSSDREDGASHFLPLPSKGPRLGAASRPFRNSGKGANFSPATESLGVPAKVLKASRMAR